MSSFRFKRFSVVNERSAMKVNSDGVLLGAAVTLDSSVHDVLDVGTGTGTIALMVAQRLDGIGTEYSITGIDIDAPSAEEAGGNFAASPWDGHLHAQNIPLQELDAAEASLDLIISNPPYFDDSLQNPDPRESAARHTTTLGYRDLAIFASRALRDGGILALILPSDVEKALVRECRSRNLPLKKITHVRTSARKQPKRIIAEFQKGFKGTAEERLLTLGSEEYTELIKDFYL